MNYSCEKCKDEGFFFDEEGKAVRCVCQLRQEKLEYLRPLKRFLSDNMKTESLVKILNKSQVIVGDDKNITGFVQLVLSVWFPQSYRICTFEELNSIGFERNSEFKSIQEYAQSRSYHIIDCRFVNKFRSRNQGFKECDSQYVVELIKEAMLNDGIVIIIVGKNPNAFFKDYQELCGTFPDFGIQYFKDGKYHSFSRPTEKDDE
jgi:hypothetical protein